VKCWAITFATLAVLSASFALAEDFKTINGKVYKDATVSRVEADGIVLKTKTGISKVYFIELPKNVQERFRPPPVKTVVVQRQPEPINVKAKQDESRKTNEGGWAGALTMSAPFFRVLAVLALVITGIVLLIVRRRL
jgi:adenylate kinase